MLPGVVAGVGSGWATDGCPLPPAARNRHPPLASSQAPFLPRRLPLLLMPLFSHTTSINQSDTQVSTRGQHAAMVSVAGFRFGWPASVRGVGYGLLGTTGEIVSQVQAEWVDDGPTHDRSTRPRPRAMHFGRHQRRPLVAARRWPRRGAPRPTPSSPRSPAASASAAPSGCVNCSALLAHGVCE